MLNYLTKLYELGALPVIRTGPTQTVAVGGTSVASAALVAQVVRLVATTDCHIAIGSAPTASATSLLLPANTPEYFACGSNDMVAVIQDNAPGTLYITAAA